MGFFKAYDMRGTFGVDFDLDLVYRVGVSLPEVVKAKRWLVGRDCRTTSEAVCEALVQGLSRGGAKVCDLGLCTTPMVYYFTAAEEFEGSVMVTASHNPPTDNGLKVSRATALPVGYAGGLDEVERRVRAGTLPPPARKKRVAAASLPGALARYIAWQKSRVDLSAIGTLSCAVDCSNGMASLLACELFPGATIINDVLDGTFPSHSPNPLKEDARRQVSRLVREKGLDCGVIFDGDADRAMFVDEKGDFVQPDYLIPIVARATRRAAGGAAGAKIIHDVRTSRGAVEALREDGFEPVMVPVGHAFAKPALRETGALCGGELAGHYYFAEFFGCDSGALAALRVLEEIARAKAEGKTFSQLVRPVVSRYANSGELNFEVAGKDAAIARVLAAARAFGRETGRSEMDGFRIEFADGWFSVRKSNTEPFLRLIVECRTREMLADWTRRLAAAIEGAGE